MSWEKSEHTEVYPRIKAPIGAKEVHGRLAIVTLACLVDLGLCQHNKASSIVVPLELHLVAFKEVLLRGWTVKLRNIIDTN